MSTQGIRRVEYLHMVSHPRREIDAKLWAIYQFLEAPEGTREPDKLIRDAAFLFLLPGMEQSSFAENDLLSICVSFLEQKGIWLTDDKPRLIRLAMNPPPFTAATLMANLNYYPPIAVTGEINYGRLMQKCRIVASYCNKSTGFGLRNGGDAIQSRRDHRNVESLQDVTPSSPMPVNISAIRKVCEVAKMPAPFEENADSKFLCEAPLLRATTATTDICDLTQRLAPESQKSEVKNKVHAVENTQKPTTGHSGQTQTRSVNCVQCGNGDVLDLGTNAHGLHFYQCNNCKRCFRHEVMQKKLPREEIASKLIISCTSCRMSDYRKSGTGAGGVQRYFCKQCKKHFIPGRIKKRKNGTTEGMKDGDDCERKLPQKKTNGLLKKAESEGGRNDALREVDYTKSVLEQVQELNSLLDEIYCNRCSGKLIQLGQVEKEIDIFACNSCHCRFEKRLLKNDNGFMKESEQYFQGQEKILTLLRGANEEVNRSAMEKDQVEFHSKIKILRDRLEQKRTSIMVKLNALWNGTDDVVTEAVQERVESGKSGDNSVTNPFQEAILLLRRETPKLEQSVTRLMHSHAQFPLSLANGTKESNDSGKCEHERKTDSKTFGHVSLTQPNDNNLTPSNNCFKLASRVVQDDGEEIEIYERCDD
ncbi:hypothetical protein ACHAW6_004013 [Cyclotella cf. meneghiniana]